MCMVFQKTANLHMPFRRPTTSVTIKIKIVTHAVAEKQQFRNQLSEQHVVRLRHRIEQLPLLLRHRLRYFRFRSPEHSCVNQHRQTAVMFDRHNQFRYSLPAIVTERALGTISQCFGLEHALFMTTAVPIFALKPASIAIGVRMNITTRKKRPAIRVIQHAAAIMNRQSKAGTAFQAIQRRR